MSDSRYITIHKEHLPKKKRTIKLHGAFEDSGKYFKCWNCGTINSIDRNVGYDGYGSIPEEYTLTTGQWLDNDGSLAEYKSSILEDEETENVIGIETNVLNSGLRFIFESEDYIVSESGDYIISDFTIVSTDTDPEGILLSHIPIMYKVETTKGCWFCGISNLL